MQSISALALVLVLAAASSLVMLVNCASNRIRSDYLFVDDGTRVTLPSADKTVLEHIKRNPLESSDPNEMLNQFTEIVKSSTTPDERDFYETLVDMANGQGGECNVNQLRYVFALMSLANSTRAVRDYIGFVRHFGADRFGGCAQKTEEHFERAKNLIKPGVEQALDEFFAVFATSSGSSGHNLDDASLLEIAKDLDLSSTQFRPKELFEIAKREFKADEPLDVVGRFIGTNCDRIQTPLKLVFGVYNLADALDAQVPTDVSTNFLKLNEYNRACLTWQENLRVARANLEAQMSQVGLKKEYSNNWYDNRMTLMKANGRW